LFLFLECFNDFSLLRLLSGCEDSSEYPTTRRRSRSPNNDITTPINDQIEQVAKRHRVPSDTVKRIISVGFID
jgi:hypothetical protein